CETDLGLHGGRVGASGAPGSRLAVTADRHVDHGRVAREHRAVVQAERGERPGAEVLDYHVGGLAQQTHHLAGGGNVQIDTQIALSGVLLRVVAADLALSRVRDAADVPGGRLDLDDFGPEVEQVLGAVGAGEHSGEVDDPYAFEWQSHRQRPSNRATPGPLAS